MQNLKSNMFSLLRHSPVRGTVHATNWIGLSSKTSIKSFTIVPQPIGLNAKTVSPAWPSICQRANIWPLNSFRTCSICSAKCSWIIIQKSMPYSWTPWTNLLYCIRATCSIGYSYCWHGCSINWVRNCSVPCMEKYGKHWVWCTNIFHRICKWKLYSGKIK